MAASDNLGPQWLQQPVQVEGRMKPIGALLPEGRLYHGSPYEMEPGTVLEPGIKGPHFKESAKGALSVTAVRADARYWAKKAAEKAGLDTAHVYEVEPTEDAKIGAWRAGPATLYEGRITKGRIVRKLD